MLLANALRQYLALVHAHVRFESTVLSLFGYKQCEQLSKADMERLNLDARALIMPKEAPRNTSNRAMFKQVFNFVDPSTNDLVDQKKWVEDGAKGYYLSRHYKGGEDTDLARAVVAWQKPCGSRPFDETYERDADTPDPAEESKKWYIDNKRSKWNKRSHDEGKAWSSGQDARPSTGWKPSRDTASRADAGAIIPAADIDAVSSTAVSERSVEHHPSNDKLAGTWGADYLAKQEAQAAQRIESSSEPASGRNPIIADWSDAVLKNRQVVHPAPEILD